MKYTAYCAVQKSPMKSVVLEADAKLMDQMATWPGSIYLVFVLSVCPFSAPGAKATDECQAIVTTMHRWRQATESPGIATPDDHRLNL